MKKKKLRLGFRKTPQGDKPITVTLHCYLCRETLREGETYPYPGRIWGDWTHYRYLQPLHLGRYMRPLICKKCHEAKIEEET